MQNNFLKSPALFLSAIIIATLSFTSCGNKNETVEVPPKMQLVDVSKYGKPFVFLAPDSIEAKGSLVITEQSYALEVRVGKSFALTIEEGDDGMEQKKADIKDGDGGINKFKRYLAEEPNLIVWESEIAKPEFHMYGVLTIGKSKYIIKDLSSTDNEPFNENQIKVLMNSFKSIKEKNMEKS